MPRSPLPLAAFLLLPIAATAAAPAPALTNPWLRLVIPARPAAGYFTLANPTDQPQTLTAASSPACARLTLHQSLHDGGQERMVMVKQVVVPPHGTLAFAPGGYHLMCMRPAPAVKIGATVPVTLHFSDGATLTADFPVKSPTAP